jgi:hypothetical protein
VAGSCEYGGETSGSGATELVRLKMFKTEVVAGNYKNDLCCIHAFTQSSMFYIIIVKY